MKQIKVVDPSGREWTVRRRWLPWRPRWRGPGRLRNMWDGLNGLDLLGGFADDFFAPILSILLAIVVIVLLVFFVLPLAVFLVEVVLTIVIVALATLLRIVLRKPWLVDAADASGEGHDYVWAVTGWRASGEAVDRIAAQLQGGAALPVLPNGRLVERGRAHL